mmetsp:Transcript_10946/g.13408  ORF Transcript_10946/g.13408 Transcript_10946/m.13408 type:complete len:127 (+) Transcript_10946:356-736(+)
MVICNLVSLVGIGIGIGTLVTGIVVAARLLFGGNGRGLNRVSSGTSSPLSLSGVSTSFGKNTNSFGEREPDVIDAVSDAVADPPSTDNMTPAVKGDERVKSLQMGMTVTVKAVVEGRVGWEECYTN